SVAEHSEQARDCRCRDTANALRAACFTRASHDPIQRVSCAATVRASRQSVRPYRWMGRAKGRSDHGKTIAEDWRRAKRPKFRPRNARSGQRLRGGGCADIFRAVIRFDSVSKNHGRQILFMEASASVNRGEKVGLVGPNGSGKTTLFRLLVGEEQPDGGQVVVDRGIRVGY